MISLIEEFDVGAARTLLGSAALAADSRKDLCKYAGVGIIHGDEDIGKVDVDYVLPPGCTIGRFVARAHGCKVSMMSMPSDARAWLASTIYHDVDIANCQPCLTAQIFAEMGIECPTIRAYVDRRDELLSQVSEACAVDRDAAKELFLRLSFSGTVKAWTTTHGVAPDSVPTFAFEYAQEMAVNVPRLLAAHPLAAAARKQTEGKGDGVSDASSFAYVVQELERRCLVALREGVTASGYTVGVMIHDGLMVRRLQGASPLDEAVLRGWERAICDATGYRVVLAEKPMVPNPVYKGGAPKRLAPAPAIRTEAKKSKPAPRSQEAGPKRTAGPKKSKSKNKTTDGVPVSARDAAQHWMNKISTKNAA
jgi:hypothetical protein